MAERLAIFGTPAKLERQELLRQAFVDLRQAVVDCQLPPADTERLMDAVAKVEQLVSKEV